MIRLPEDFLSRMRAQLGDEFDSFYESYQAPRRSGLRVNTLKCAPEQFPRIAPGDWEPIPWVHNGYFVPEGTRMGASPLYAAGVFYLQEPSAMTPASRLNVSPGERVLDLCAAPGGKSTELAARLQGKGLLVANDISNARAKALLRNLELFGSGNILVTNETPGKLAEVFEGYFDKVLVDAPCSGEGMFRKDEAVIGTWTPDRPAFFAAQQKDITANAVKMLREGGVMMYSTCTFSPVENEGTISWLLEQFPQMQLMEIKGYEGFAPGNPEWGNGDPSLRKCVRIWPHRMQGEGHFLALLKKGAPNPEAWQDAENIPERIKPACCPSESAANISQSLYREGRRSKKKKAGKKRNGRPENTGNSSALSHAQLTLITEFFRQTDTDLPLENLELRGEKVFLSPALPSGTHRLHFLRNGLYLGDLKKDRFEPSQPFAMTLSADTFTDCLDLDPDDDRIRRYLAGEPIPVADGETISAAGWKLVCVQGFSLGWGKLVNGTLKNKYPAGWRRN